MAFDSLWEETITRLGLPPAAEGITLPDVLAPANKPVAGGLLARFVSARALGKAVPQPASSSRYDLI